MDEISEIIRYLMMAFPVVLIGYFYHAKYVVRGTSTKRAYLSKVQKRMLLLSEWDQPSKLDVLFRAICITPYILLLSMFYFFWCVIYDTRCLRNTQQNLGSYRIYN